MADSDPLLRKAGCPENVIEHCRTVARIALRIAGRVRVPIDRQLIERGALLHDIGRGVTHGIDHAVVGGDLARKMGLPEGVARVIERHIGAGIPAAEARELGLPVRDYLPMTREEKIVAYADKLARGAGEISFEESLKEFERRLGKGHPAIQRLLRLHEEVLSWME
jgi:uncharacterized protein